MIIAGLVAGMTFTVLEAGGVGPFAAATDEPMPTGPAALETTDIRASSALEPDGEHSYEAANVLDGDPTTSWREAEAGLGEGEWIELTLAERAEIAQVLVWNGDQRDGEFESNPRVSSIVIDVEDRTFVVDLLDIDGPQAIDLPEPVASDRVRLTIAGVFPGEASQGGETSQGTAISRLQVRGTPLEEAPG